MIAASYLVPHETSLLLENVTVLSLQNATVLLHVVVIMKSDLFLTNCSSYNKTRRLLQNPLVHSMKAK